jgi:dTMP kinase
LLVALEGIDSSGKATASALLADYFKSQKHNVVSLAFPRYDGPIGKVIRDLLTTPGSKPELKQAAMLADRLAAVDLLTDKSKTIICDRYVMSGIVYGMADGLEEPWLWAIHKTLPKADFQVLLDIDPQVSSKRRDTPRDENEKNLALLNAARNTYLDIWDQNEMINPYRWITVDATQEPKAVVHEIISAYNDLVDSKKNSWTAESEAAY